MIIIKKKISLEQFKSRVNSSFPCYGMLDDENGNYNKFPKTIVMPKSEKYGSLSGKKISWYNLIRIYNKLYNYKKLLYHNSCREKPYANIKELMEYEPLYIQTYDMDSEYDSNGGNYSYEYISSAILNRVHIPYGEEIKINNFNTIKIPYNTYEYWGCLYLSFGDIRKWYNWFNINENSTNNCVIDEYNNRGGIEMHKWLKYQLDQKFLTNPPVESTFSISVYMQRSFDNMGDAYIIESDNVNDSVHQNSDFNLEFNTNSKINIFLSNKIVVDNLGNRLNGIYPQGKKTIGGAETEYFMPIKEGCTIWLPYEIGCQKQIIEIDNNTYLCHILHTAHLYTEINGIKQIITNNFDLNNKINNLNKDKIYCDLTYRFNALIDGNSNIINETPYIDYTDTYELIKKSQPYWYNEKIQYNVYYYDMIKIGTTKGSLSDKKDYIIYNNPHIIYGDKFGIVSHEKIEGDIYIDRGISNAFRNHLALQEVKSMEGLIQYGNNLFNIENN